MALRLLNQPLLKEKCGEIAVPFQIGIAVFLHISARSVEGLASRVERIRFEPRCGETRAGDLALGKVHQLRADTRAGIVGMDMQGVNEVVPPVNKASNSARTRHDIKFLPAMTNIGLRTLRRPERFSGLLGDVGPPSAFERVVEDADQGILIR